MTDRPHPSDGHLLDIAPHGPDDPGLGRWARRGTEQGEGMVYVADDDTPDVTALVAVLVANGVGAAHEAARDGRLVVVDPGRFYGDEFDDVIRMASDGGRRGVRTFGGPHRAACVLDETQFENFERQLAASWAERGVTSVCRYHDRDLTDTHRFAQAFARHRTGWAEPYLRANQPRPGLLVLDGEADASNAHLLGAAFAEVLPDAGPLLLVDCAALRFAAVGAWRTAAAAVRRHPDTRVQLIDPTPLTGRVLMALDLHTTFEITHQR